MLRFRPDRFCSDLRRRLLGLGGRRSRLGRRISLSSKPSRTRNTECSGKQHKRFELYNLIERVSQRSLQFTKFDGWNTVEQTVFKVNCQQSSQTLIYGTISDVNVGLKCTHLIIIISKQLNKLLSLPRSAILKLRYARRSQVVRKMFIIFKNLDAISKGKGSERQKSEC